MAPSDTNGALPNGEDGADPELMAGPLIVKTQYIKDLSFENPGAPDLLAEMTAEPEVEINVNVEVNKLSDVDFEVALTIHSSATVAGKPLFIAELEYAGIFELSAELPEEHHSAILLIECPRLLFPFARNILADVTREGGMPPLMLQPIDFMALFEQQMAEQGDSSGQPIA